YDVGVRLKGSQRGRAKDVRVGFTLGFPADQPFRGVHGTVAVDRSGAGDQYSQKEMMVKHAVQAAGGIPGMYDDLINVIAPISRHTGAAMLLMSRYDDVFLDSFFENGSDGTMFEYELIYYPTSVDSSTGLKRPNPDSVSGVPLRSLGDDKEAYRWHYQIKNNLISDDYSGIMNALEALGTSGAEFTERTNELLDVPQWLRANAIQILFGIGDNYSGGSQHNGIFYVHPNGKVLHFPWDMDFTFSQSASGAVTGNTEMRKFLADPLHKRTYYAILTELVQTVFNRDYMEEWATHYSTFLPRENLETHLSFIETRSRKASTDANRAVEKVVFQITNNGGQAFSVDGPEVTLTGQGWINVAKIRHDETGIEYSPTWTGGDTWELTLPLTEAENTVTLQALDFLGGVGSIFAPVGKDSIVVTNSGFLPLASSETVAISEIHYHPAGPSEAELGAGYADQDDFEFIELTNRGEEEVDLTGSSFINGIDFRFPAGTTLAPGAFAVVVRNEAAFKERYGNDIPIAGVYSGQLSNGGERLVLSGLTGETIADFSYNDRAPWAIAADGEGFSLTLTEVSADPLMPASWAASAISGGSPGSGEAAPEPVALSDWLEGQGAADPLADPDGDGIPLLLDFALGTELVDEKRLALPTTTVVEENGQPFPALAYRQRVGATGITYLVEWSADLVTWVPDPGDGSLVVNSGSTSNGDGTQTTTIRTAAAATGGVAGFFRLRVTAD
ncbi:MAG: lamin tail domain-containing protein, partial [Verrucomicrobiota bacterium]